MLIGIDPGHGGSPGDPGAIGPSGLQEKDVNLVISQKLAWYLQRAGLATFLTRDNDNDVDLITRAALINNMKCDYCISVHCNAVDDPDPDYISTFIQGVGGQAEALARHVQKQMVTVLGWPDGGVREANLYMGKEGERPDHETFTTRKTDMPAILVECGFISNPYQEEWLGQEMIQGKFAAAIASGVLNFLDELYPSEAHMDNIALNIGNKTYVPLDGFLKAHGLGQATSWDPYKQEAGYTLGGKKHTVLIGSDRITEVK